MINYLLLFIMMFLMGLALTLYALSRPYSTLSYERDGKYIGALGMIIMITSVILMLTTDMGRSVNVA